MEEVVAKMAVPLAGNSTVKSAIFYSRPPAKFKRVLPFAGNFDHPISVAFQTRTNMLLPPRAHLSVAIEAGQDGLFLACCT